MSFTPLERAAVPELLTACAVIVLEPFLNALHGTVQNLHPRLYSITTTDSTNVFSKLPSQSYKTTLLVKSYPDAKRT